MIKFIYQLPVDRYRRINQLDYRNSFRRRGRHGPHRTHLDQSIMPMTKPFCQSIEILFAHSKATFTRDTCSPDTSCIHLSPLLPIVSCIGNKIVVTATCIHLYPQVEHCLELVSGYIIWCKRGFLLTMPALQDHLYILTPEANHSVQMCEASKTCHRQLCPLVYLTESAS